MMPLWMTAIRPDWSVCGCAFGLVGAPCVAQRVCPMPSVPYGMLRLRAPARACEILPAAFAISSPLPFTTAMPGGVVAAVLQAPQPLEEQARRLAGSDVADDSAHRAMILTARVLGPRPPALPLRAGVGASAIRRTIGSVPDGRTCSQRSGHASRSPSRSSAAASAKRRRSRSYSGPRARGRAAPWPSRSCSGARPPTSSRDRYPSRGKEMQDQGHPQGRVAAEVQRREHHPAVPLAADHRPLVSHGAGDVGFADRRPDEPGARRPAPHPRPPGWWRGSPRRSGRSPDCCVHPTRRAPRRRACSPRRSARPGLVDQRQPVHVGIDREPDVGAAARAPAGPARPGSRGPAPARGGSGRRAPG